MLLQRQYSLWKWVNILIGIVLIWFVVVSLFFQWKINKTKTITKQKNASIVNLNNKLETLKKDESYKKFNMAKFIEKNENNTNYYALYQYLKSIKDDIQKVLRNAGITKNRFQLSVSKQEVNISTIVPNYNFLYNSNWWLFTMLEKRPFIQKIFVNSYQSKDWLIYFDINLKTK